MLTQHLHLYLQFVVDSFRLVNESNHLNNSKEDCESLILACSIREQSTADATSALLENKVWFNWFNAWGIIGFFQS